MANTIRDAVVIVHGIGEQRPLTTLDGFVDHLTGPWDRKPEDYLIEDDNGVSDAGSRLRRIKVTWQPGYRVGDELLVTDFFEYHWAPAVEGTTWSQVTAFLRRLLLSPEPLPGRLRAGLWYFFAIGLPLVTAGVTLFTRRGGVVSPIQERLATPAGLAAALVLVGCVSVLGVVLGSGVRSRLRVGVILTMVGVGVAAASVFVGSAIVEPDVDQTGLQTSFTWLVRLGLVLGLLLVVAGLVRRNSWTGIAFFAVGYSALAVSLWPWLSTLPWTEPTIRVLVTWWGGSTGTLSLVAIVLWITVKSRSLDWRFALAAGLTSVLAVSSLLVFLIGVLPMSSGSPERWKLLARVVGAVGLAAVAGFILKSFGDVARYLDPSPTNVEAIERIRSGGVLLLDRLHKSTSQYRRIVVVGHSMGSLVAYDMVCAYWAQVNRTIQVPAPNELGQDMYDSLEDEGFSIWGWHSLGSDSLPRDAPHEKSGQWTSWPPSTESTADPAESQRASAYWGFQDEVFEALSTPNPGKWRVSDLVTMAFPYTHADYLIAGNSEKLRKLQRQRRHSTSPPQPQTIENRYRYQPVGETTWRFHHTAVFAPTRWTNTYFWSDIVGGPATPLWGPGIEDVRLQTGGMFFFPIIHTKYDSRANSLSELRRVILRDADLGDSIEDNLRYSLQIGIKQLDALRQRLKLDWGNASDLMAAVPLLRRLNPADRTVLAKSIKSDGSPTSDAIQRFLDERGPDVYLRLLSAQTLESGGGDEEELVQ